MGPGGTIYILANNHMWVYEVAMELRMLQEIMGIISEYQDFINTQKSMYIDACAGFSENKRVIELQKGRINVPTKSSINKQGLPIMMRTSYEDPSLPDVIHQRIIRSDDYISLNSTNGAHEQQQAKGIIVFIFHFWEDEIRFRLAKAKDVKKNLITSDIMGDIRLIRQTVIHDKGVLEKSNHEKLMVLKDFFEPEKALILTNEIM